EGWEWKRPPLASECSTNGGRGVLPWWGRGVKDYFWKVSTSFMMVAAMPAMPDSAPAMMPISLPTASSFSRPVFFSQSPKQLEPLESWPSPSEEPASEAESSLLSEEPREVVMVEERDASAPSSATATAEPDTATAAAVDRASRDFFNFMEVFLLET